jgi:DNA-binding MarR family transcriptional regulator
MSHKQDLISQVLMQSRDQGVGSVLFRNALAKLIGLNSTESECLSFLAIKQVSSPTEISHYTGLTSGATTTMLDRLEKNHYISRMPNPEDRRGVLIRINEHYLDLVKPVISGLQAAHNSHLDKYTDGELLVIIRFLSRFNADLRVHTPRQPK